MNFSPISYDHAAKLIEQRPWDVSRSESLLVQAQQKALDVYQTGTCVVGLDIYNLEIEAYGVEVLDAGGNGVPTAGSPLFEVVEELILELKAKVAAGQSAQDV